MWKIIGFEIEGDEELEIEAEESRAFRIDDRLLGLVVW